MPTLEQKGSRAALAGPNRLPAVAVASVLVLIAAAWLFFLATYELGKVNYERKGGADAYKAARAHEREAKRAP
jgi:hypothetical protein